MDFMNRFSRRITTAGLPLWTGALGLLLCAILMHVAQGAPQESLPATVKFNRDIRPILSDKCFQCHGPASQMAALRFDLEDGAKHALSGGRFAIVPGDPVNSQVIKRITAPNPAVRMPRSQAGAAEGEPLTGRQIALLTRWIEQGATWQAPGAGEVAVGAAAPAAAVGGGG